MRRNEWLFNVNTHPHSICAHHYSHEDQLSLTAAFLISTQTLFTCIVILKRSPPGTGYIQCSVKNSDYGWSVRGGERGDEMRYLQPSKCVLLLQGNREHQSWIRTSGKLCSSPPSVFPETLISGSKMNVQQMPWNSREVFLRLPHDCLGFRNFYSFIRPIPFFFYISSIIFAFVFLLKGVAC